MPTSVKSLTKGGILTIHIDVSKKVKIPKTELSQFKKEIRKTMKSKKPKAAKPAKKKSSGEKKRPVIIRNITDLGEESTSSNPIFLKLKAGPGEESDDEAPVVFRDITTPRKITKAEKEAVAISNARASAKIRNQKPIPGFVMITAPRDKPPKRAKKRQAKGAISIVG